MPPWHSLCLCIHYERLASVREVRTIVKQQHRWILSGFALCWGSAWPTLPSIYLAAPLLPPLPLSPQTTSSRATTLISCKTSAARSTTYISSPPFPRGTQLVVVTLTLAFVSAALYYSYAAASPSRASSASSPPNLHPANSENSALTPSRYFRLMGMALTDVRPRRRYRHEHGLRRGVPMVFIPEETWCRTYLHGGRIAQRWRPCGVPFAKWQGWEREKAGMERLRDFVPRFPICKTGSRSMTDAEDTSKDTSTTYSRPKFTLVLPFVVSHGLSLRLVLIAFRLVLPSRAPAQTRKRHGLMPPRPRLSFFAHSCIVMGIISVSLRLCSSIGTSTS
ncbi:hypothetical protein C8R45DRAFT_1174002 [Mycena sanguinolenta]|nr:hypothetical protein C8R45DRAFT_1174002 [Mycena sanguinolenta]